MAAAPSAYPRETEFFGFDPVSWVNDVYNAVDDYLADGADALERILVADGPEAQAADTSEGADRLLVALRGVFDTNFDKLEMYCLRNIFRVPADLPLPAEESAAAAAAVPEAGELPSAEQQAALEGELAELRRALRGARHANARLRLQARSLESVLPAAEAATKALLQATQPLPDWQHSEHGDIAQGVRAVCRHADALRESKAQLDDLAQQLRGSRPAASPATQAQRLERVFAPSNQPQPSVEGLKALTASFIAVA